MVSCGTISLGGATVRCGKNESVEKELNNVGEGSYNPCGTAQITINDAYARTLAAAGGDGTQISMYCFYGKSAAIPITYHVPYGISNTFLC